jgi:hypothetical protein
VGGEVTVNVISSNCARVVNCGYTGAESSRDVDRGVDPVAEHESMRVAVGVHIIANNLSGIIYTQCFGVYAVGDVQRREGICDTVRHVESPLSIL